MLGHRSVSFSMTLLSGQDCQLGLPLLREVRCSACELPAAHLQLQEQMNLRIGTLAICYALPPRSSFLVDGLCHFLSQC